MVISNISRHCAGVYECEASNGVPPPVSRRMEITVECKLTLLPLPSVTCIMSLSLSLSPLVFLLSIMSPLSSFFVFNMFKPLIGLKHVKNEKKTGTGDITEKKKDEMMMMMMNGLYWMMMNGYKLTFQIVCHITHKLARKAKMPHIKR